MNMSKNQKIIYSVVAVVVAIGLFFGGVAYGKSSAGGARGGQFGQAGQFGARAGGATGARGARGGNVVAGEVLSKDATSVTIKTQDGGSKIVLTASSTSVMKAATGSLADVAVGGTVTVIGTANSDGSVTAQSIQLRPAGKQGMGGGYQGRGAGPAGSAQ